MPRLGYEARALGESDGVALQSLLERATDYFEIVTGSQPAPSAASDLLWERLGFTYEQRVDRFDVLTRPISPPI